MRRFIAPVAAAFAVVAFAACSADATDFKEQGEKFIEGDEVRETMAGVRMSNAECEEPANTDKDTVYSCTATGSDDNIWVFQIEITGSTSLRVIAGQVAPSPSTPDPVDSSLTTVADSTVPTGPASEPLSGPTAATTTTTVAAGTTAGGSTTTTSG